MQAGTPGSLLSVIVSADDPRSRLVAGMAQALNEKSFGGTSVADVVRLARVSKRTFYEHFATREQCYLATYEAISTIMLKRIGDAAAPPLSVEDRLTAAASAYLSTLQELPALTRTFFTEIQLAGSEALVARRRIHQRFASLLQTLVEQGRLDCPWIPALSAELAVALVGAINELLLVRIEEGREHELSALTSTVVQLIRALVLAPASGRTSAR
jgi:AcrR family transcriptional regulator